MATAQQNQAERQLEEELLMNKEYSCKRCGRIATLAQRMKRDDPKFCRCHTVAFTEYQVDRPAMRGGYFDRDYAASVPLQFRPKR